ncbi:MAG: ABC transporter permease [Thioalkalivibrionaceae bacterium]
MTRGVVRASMYAVSTFFAPMRFWWRGIWRHPAQSALSAGAIAVALATIVAIDVVTRVAWQEFERSLAATTGAATHRIVAVEGADLPESLYVALRLAGMRSAAPVAEAFIRIEAESLGSAPSPAHTRLAETVARSVAESTDEFDVDSMRETLTTPATGELEIGSAPVRRILGIDPFAEAGLRLPAAAIGAEAVQRLFLRPGYVLVPAADALAPEGDEETRRWVVAATGSSPSRRGSESPREGSQSAGSERENSRFEAPTEATLERPERVAPDVTGVAAPEAAPEAMTEPNTRWMLTVQRLPTASGSRGAESPEVERALAGLWWSDVATVQSILGKPGVLSRIDVALLHNDAPNPGDWTTQRLTRWLAEQAEATDHAGFRLEAVGAETLPAQALARAFRTNLLAMGLLAILIAGFLVIHQQGFAVLRRRREIADLRLVGVTPRSVRWLVRIEALGIGIVGIVFGAALALGLVLTLVGPLETTLATQFGVTTGSGGPEGLRRGALAAVFAAWLWAAPLLLLALVLLAEPAAREAAAVRGVRAGTLYAQESQSATRRVLWPTLIGALALSVGALLLVTLASATSINVADANKSAAWVVLDTDTDTNGSTFTHGAIFAVATMMIETVFDVDLRALGGASLLLGFVGLFALAIGGLLVGTQLLWALAALMVRRGGGVIDRVAVGPWAAVRWLFRLALEDWRRAPRRGQPAVMGLSLALAGALGVSVLVSSFRIAVEQWLDDALSSDVYVVATSDERSGWSGREAARVLQRLEAVDGVVSISRSSTQRAQMYRGADVGMMIETMAAIAAETKVEAQQGARVASQVRPELGGDGVGREHEALGEAQILVVQTHDDAFSRVDHVMAPIERDPQRLAALWQRGMSVWDNDREQVLMPGVVLTETLAMRTGLRPGDEIALRGPGVVWPQPAIVLSVIRDYASPEGRVWLAVDWAETFGLDAGRADAFGLRLAADETERGRAEDWESLGAALASLPLSPQVIDPSTVREASLEQFERTFAVTHSLRAIAVFVAVLALISALAAIELEQRPNRALLRVLGLTPAGVAGFTLARGAWLGLGAGVLAVPLGFALGAALIVVVNRLSFGWSMAIEWPWVAASTTLLWALAAALGAAAVLALGRLRDARRDREGLLFALKEGQG